MKFMMVETVMNNDGNKFIKLLRVKVNMNSFEFLFTLQASLDHGSELRRQKSARMLKIIELENNVKRIINRR